MVWPLTPETLRETVVPEMMKSTDAEVRAPSALLDVAKFGPLVSVPELFFTRALDLRTVVFRPEVIPTTSQVKEYTELLFKETTERTAVAVPVVDPVRLLREKLRSLKDTDPPLNLYPLLKSQVNWWSAVEVKADPASVLVPSARTMHPSFRALAYLPEAKLVFPAATHPSPEIQAEYCPEARQLKLPTTAE